MQTYLYKLKSPSIAKAFKRWEKKNIFYLYQESYLHELKEAFTAGWVSGTKSKKKVSKKRKQVK